MEWWEEREPVPEDEVEAHRQALRALDEADEKRRSRQRDEELEDQALDARQRQLTRLGAEVKELRSRCDRQERELSVLREKNDRTRRQGDKRIGAAVAALIAYVGAWLLTGSNPGLEGVALALLLGLVAYAGS